MRDFQVPNPTGDPNNDHRNIQTAISNAATVAEPALVQLQSGRYRIHQELHVRGHNIAIKGRSQTSTIVEPVDKNRDGFRVGNEDFLSSEIEISELAVRRDGLQREQLRDTNKETTNINIFLGSRVLVNNVTISRAGRGISVGGVKTSLHGGPPARISDAITGLVNITNVTAGPGDHHVPLLIEKAADVTVSNFKAGFYETGVQISDTANNIHILNSLFLGQGDIDGVDNTTVYGLLITCPTYIRYGQDPGEDWYTDRVFQGQQQHNRIRGPFRIVIRDCTFEKIAKPNQRYELIRIAGRGQNDAGYPQRKPITDVTVGTSYLNAALQ